MNDYWEHQEAINCDNYQCIFNDIKTRIRDQYIQEFFTNINNNARLEKYCIFKTEFVYEEYLNIMDQKARKVNSDVLLISYWWNVDDIKM